VSAAILYIACSFLLGCDAILKAFLPREDYDRGSDSGLILKQICMLRESRANQGMAFIFDDSDGLWNFVYSIHKLKLVFTLDSANRQQRLLHM